MTEQLLPKVEVFSGTGGVGKTTLATSRALYLAEKGKSILLITIDPAKRLKEILGISDEDAGKVLTIEKPFDLACNLDVQLMSPHETIKRIASDSQSLEVLNSRILKILTKPYGGLNEILALVELQLNLSKNQYDCIVLDTPPGSHFLDFLEGIDKIRDFFDQSFIDIFNYLDESKRTKLNAGRKMLTMMISSGVKKLLDYLAKVTGAKFIEDFMNAIGAIYSTKETFLAALNLQNEMKRPEFTKWYLATSVDQNKVSEAIDLKDLAKEYFGKNATLLINKSLGDELNTWQCEDNSVENKLKNSLIHKEQAIENGFKNQFGSIFKFREIMQASPQSHVISLKEEWGQFN
jgi:anion-transporting  ArsA/GET3 family ATPase